MVFWIKNYTVNNIAVMSFYMSNGNIFFFFWQRVQILTLGNIYSIYEIVKSSLPNGDKRTATYV